MSLRTWLREWLELELTEFKEDIEQDLRDLNRKLVELKTEADWNKKQLIRFDEILRMPTDFRLAQAKNSLNLLTEFINEIQSDVEALRNKH